ncbi:AEP3 [Candida jiufengensis]|uniref:AEP3 n=1 Tax=Candida jiufengensis TaxID=497108 RepID=UPI0022252C5B|nr:AEP3 [Candida jiufengensis]KAI5954398.1 AEP3 [Candida jiufengensis]
MISIKETISRLGRTVKSIESIRQNLPKHQPSSSTENQHNTTPQPPKFKYLKSTHIPKNEFKNHKSTTKLFQEFLKPLNLENLKSFDTDKKDYDTSNATSNWQKQNSKNLNVQVEIYMENRLLFQKLLKFLVEITPVHLKNINNVTYNQHIINQEQQKNLKHQQNTDCFHEIPALPTPLTVENFESYIYNLTHKRYHYLNSSSLKSGIIPKILLFTHKLDNEKFKPYRSTTTFNYLIKYFGYDKNQSLFARELLLVMNKEGHLINEETINNLLKIASKHSKIRSNSNSFKLVMKYLKLSQSLGIDINLDTWTKIYDTIGNLHLKELYLETIQNSKLPITRSLIIRILDDFMNITKDTREVIFFIENDLNYKNWQNDELIKNKIIFHKAKNGDVSSVIEDDYGLKFFLQGIKNDGSLNFKSAPMFHQYCKYSNSNSPPKLLQIYTLLIKQLLDENKNIKILKQLLFIVRGLIHDATTSLNIPTTVIQYENDDSVAQTIPENYKIIARQTKDKLIKLQASIEYVNSKITNSNLVDPWIPFTSKELTKWNELKTQMSSKAEDIFMNQDQETNIKHTIPQKELKLIVNKIKSKSSISQKRQNIEISKIGINKYVERILNECSLYR